MTAGKNLRYSKRRLLKDYLSVSLIQSFWKGVDGDREGEKKQNSHFEFSNTSELFAFSHS